MRTLIESLKRLYKIRRTTKEKIQQLRETGTITREEAEYILGEQEGT